MPALLFQVVIVFTDVVILALAGYFFFKLRDREKNLEDREKKVDTEYHRIVDDAQAKERKILDDASAEAEKIIVEAKYVNKEIIEKVSQAMQKMAADIQVDAADAASRYMAGYQGNLEQLSAQSMTDFANITHGLEENLKKQIQDFQNNLLPSLEKELEDYKQLRFEQAEKTITVVVQRVAQEVLNKAITVPDHQNLMIEALEKAKKEGLFN